MCCVSTNQDEFSLLVEKWNTQRTQALGHSLLRVLYPLMERELRTKLLQEAKEFVTQVCVCACVRACVCVCVCVCVAHDTQHTLHGNTCAHPELTHASCNKNKLFCNTTIITTHTKTDFIKNS